MWTVSGMSVTRFFHPWCVDTVMLKDIVLLGLVNIGVRRGNESVMLT